MNCKTQIIFGILLIVVLANNAFAAHSELNVSLEIREYIQTIVLTANVTKRMQNNVSFLHITVQNLENQKKTVNLNITFENITNQMNISLQNTKAKEIIQRIPVIICQSVRIIAYDLPNTYELNFSIVRVNNSAILLEGNSCTIKEVYPPDLNIADLSIQEVELGENNINILSFQPVNSATELSPENRVTGMIVEQGNNKDKQIYKSSSAKTKEWVITIIIVCFAMICIIIIRKKG